MNTKIERSQFILTEAQARAEDYAFGQFVKSLLNTIQFDAQRFTILSYLYSQQSTKLQKQLIELFFCDQSPHFFTEEEISSKCPDTIRSYMQKSKHMPIEPEKIEEDIRKFQSKLWEVHLHRKPRITTELISQLLIALIEQDIKFANRSKPTHVKQKFQSFAAELLTSQYSPEHDFVGYVLKHCFEYLLTKTHIRGDLIFINNVKLTIYNTFSTTKETLATLYTPQSLALEINNRMKKLKG